MPYNKDFGLYTLEHFGTLTYIDYSNVYHEEKVPTVPGDYGRIYDDLYDAIVSGTEKTIKDEETILQIENIRNRTEENTVTRRKELLLMSIGTISTSFITDNFIEALKEEGSITLTAVYSRTEEKAADFTKKHGANHYVTDLEAMANSELIDCIYIASPNSMHFEHTLLFLKNKKHVICEKPIFSNKAELKKAYEVAEAND